MKPTLTLPSDGGANTVNIIQTTKKVLAHLASLGEFFRKGLVIMRLAIDKESKETVLTPLLAAYLHTRLFDEFQITIWARTRGGGQLRDATKIEDGVLKAMLGSHLVETAVLPVKVIAKTPFLVLANGELIQLVNGYNPQRGGVLVTGTGKPEMVSIERAVRTILDLLQDYDFATPSDKSRAVAAIFCAAMRLAGIFERTPFIYLEADDSQAGKTKLWAAICAMLGQVYGVVVYKNGGVGSLDEMIGERLSEGWTAVLIDNFRGKFDSAYFEAALTMEGGALSARIAGERSVPVDPRLVQFGFTSNGAALTVDTTNRALMIRIRKRRRDYVFHQLTDATGKVVGMREHVEAHQALYHGCVNAILLDWWHNGAQRKDCIEHDFKESMGALDYIVQHYFGLPPLLDGHRDALDRTTKPGLTWLRQIALKAATRWFVTNWTAKVIVEKCVQEGIPITGAPDGCDTDTAAKQVGINMAAALGKANQIMIDDIEITRSEVKDAEGRSRKVYTFVRREL